MRLMNKYGFTLIELMVTVAVIGILSMIAIPSFIAYKPTLQMNKAVNDFQGMLQKARFQAIRDRGTCTIEFAADSYTLTCTNSKTNQSMPLDYGPKIEFTDTAGNPPNGILITFNSRGTSNTRYIYFNYADGNQYYRVGPLISGAINKEFSRTPW